MERTCKHMVAVGLYVDGNRFRSDYS